MAETPPNARPSRLAALADRVAVSGGTDADADEGDDADGDRSRLTVEAPAAGEPVGTVPACTPADVRRAVDRARTAGEAWAARPVAERAAVLRRFHDRVLDARAELLDLLQVECGKARPDALEEVLDVANTASYYADVAGEVLAPERRRGAVPLLTRTVERRVPAGVVGVIAPWNYPLTLSISDALPALVAGNAVVVKPDERTPFATLRAVELLEDAGLPADCCRVVTGEGSVVGEPLIAAVDHVAFTGSTAVGREVAATAGRHLTPCSLELGGKNPMVVLADADVDAAARSAAAGAYANAGQLCLSIERIYVESSIGDAFRDALVEATRRRRLGCDYGWGPDVGSLTTADQLEKTRAHVDEAVAAGASVLTGGRHRPDLGPYVYEPTVLADVPPGATVADEETFGPVVAVHEVADADEAVRRANETPYGLNASVWTGDPGRGRAIAERIEAGTVNVGDAYVAAWGSVDAPMGGMGDSGIGRRHARQALRTYTEAQTIAVQRLGPLAPPDWLPDRLLDRAATAGLRAREAVRRRLGGVGGVEGTGGPGNAGRSGRAERVEGTADPGGSERTGRAGGSGGPVDHGSGGG